jgi:hypothetical protein
VNAGEAATRTGKAFGAEIDEKLAEPQELNLKGRSVLPLSSSISPTSAFEPL